MRGRVRTVTARGGGGGGSGGMEGARAGRTAGLARDVLERARRRRRRPAGRLPASAPVSAAGRRRRGRPRRREGGEINKKRRGAASVGGGRTARVPQGPSACVRVSVRGSQPRACFDVLEAFRKPWSRFTLGGFPPAFCLVKARGRGRGAPTKKRPVLGRTAGPGRRSAR